MASPQLDCFQNAPIVEHVKPGIFAVGYLDSSDAELIALTRMRRRERAHIELTEREVVRWSVATGNCTQKVARRKVAMMRWRKAQWREGNRRCTYCRIKLVMPPHETGMPDNAATVDDVCPVSKGGDSAPWNWAMCCLACNGAKADMSERDYRRLFECA